ncbi:DUF1398 domain-containing protein [Flavobacterium sp. ACAM 123]|jgi:uncharacterized protein YbcV (DUF1398 family)|uniref:DUF1398 domain-containing protein n=1 Tax=Flavobacterium sp. ACAM 123 TaxID=1189620 RepID=UPI0002DD1B44|nr:DUF1398 family protein [Flavobacterium sp. ACAM 123]
MFTLEQIKQAHDKVQTGADFPNYIQELIDLGVKGYDTIIKDGRVAYYGSNDDSVSTDKKYNDIKITSTANKERFIEFLVMHQDGQTDYFTFCQQAAQSGIAKSRIDIIEMTCTYFDTSGNAIVIEKIPS